MLETCNPDSERSMSSLESTSPTENDKSSPIRSPVTSAGVIEQSSEGVEDKTPPLLKVTYCYICNARIDVQRSEGDKKRYDELPENIQFCKDNFIEPGQLDIVPLLCTSSACHDEYESLPSTRYAEEVVSFKPGVWFDGGSFFDFPQRLGRQEINYDQIINPWDTAVNKEYLHDNGHLLEPLFQAWLFFGFCGHFLGVHFKPQDCITKDEQGYPVVILSPLVSAIRRWMPTVEREGAEAERERLSLERALLFMRQLLTCTITSNFDGNLRVFIASAAELVQQAANCIYPEEIYSQMGIFWPVSRTKHLEEKGWCPFEANQFQYTLARCATRSLIYALDRRNLRKPHRECSESYCFESRVALAKQPGPSHRHDCATKAECVEFGLSQSQMESIGNILSNGRFPLIRILVDKAEVAQSLEVVSFGPGIRYIAISHVWAQGLGNKIDNSLYRCQLTNLYRLVKYIYCSLTNENEDYDVLLWVDTLCCPVERRNLRGSRKNALSVMAKTYQSATAVLALDTEWEHLNRRNLSSLEVAAHIFTASWIWRLWTLQESALADNVWFQFGDRPVNAHALLLSLRAIRRAHDIRDRIASLFMIVLLLNIRFKSGIYTGVRREMTVMHVTRAAQNRSVMHPEDEPYCVATLLGLDTTPILEGRELKSRWQAFWKLMSQHELIPRKAAFTVGTLEVPGYSWAPATFFQSEATVAFLDTRAEKATLTESGLRINGYGIVLHHIPALPGFDLNHLFLAPCTEQQSHDAANNINVEFSPSRWSVMMVRDNSLSLRDILAEPREFALIRFHLSSHTTPPFDERTYMLVEIRDRTSSEIICVQRARIQLASLSAGQGALAYWARLRAEELRTQDEFKALQFTETERKREAHSQLWQSFGSVQAFLSRPDNPQELAEIDASKERYYETQFSINIQRNLTGNFASVVETLDESQVWCLL